MCGVGTLFHSSDDAVDIKPTGCRSWTCDVCAPLRKASCEISARRGRPDSFLTLTVRPSIGISPLDRRGRIGRAFPLLIRRMERYTGMHIPYYATCEKTKRGEPHLHVLMRAKFVPQKLISQWWEELVGAKVVWIERPDSAKGAAKYISKYLNKALHKFGNYKRYWMTRDWVLPPQDGEKVSDWQPRRWTWSSEWPDDIVKGYRLRGWWLVPGEVERGVRRLLSPEYYRQAFSYADRWRGG